MLAWSAVALGPSLTPFPRPSARGRLTQLGPYRFVRHPMYMAVMFLAIGYSLAGLSIARFIALLALISFLNVKARHEDALLRERYSKYDAYAATTKRFIPFVY